MSSLARRVFDAHMGPLDTPACQGAFHRIAAADAMVARAATNRRWVAESDGVLVGMVEDGGGS